MTDVYEDVAVR